MKKITILQWATANQHSLKLRNYYIQELNKAIDTKNKEQISFFQREINEINEHLDEMRFLG
jgi:ribosomal protein S15P/S13E